MRMTLRYDREADRLDATTAEVEHDDLEWLDVGSGLRLGVDRSQSRVVGFRVDGARHFVSYHPIWRFFGDDGLRQLAEFQSQAVAGSGEVERIVDVSVPNRHATEVKALLRSHLVV